MNRLSEGIWTSLLGLLFLGCLAGCTSSEAGEKDDVVLRVVFLGDAEPKPEAAFPNMEAAVEQMNALSEQVPVDFVIGVGDIAHKGTEIQYEAATEVLTRLMPPFYPIMGNEEHGHSTERYLSYARQWNAELEGPRYVQEYEHVAFVFASPDDGRDFNDEGAAWVRDQLQRLAPKPVMLIVHAAPAGAFPENPDKGVHNELFRNQVMEQPNLTALISGDLHMDMDRVNHSKQIGHTHYLHIPALERTKIPDESNHTPMFRVMTISEDGRVEVETYAVGDPQAREAHAYAFELSAQK